MLNFKFRQHQAGQEIGRLAFQKSRQHHVRRDVRAGLALIAIGAAVYLAPPPPSSSNRARFASFAAVPVFAITALGSVEVVAITFALWDDDASERSS